LLDKSLEEGSPHDFILYRDFVWTVDDDLRFEEPGSPRIQPRLEQEWKRLAHSEVKGEGETERSARARISESVRHEVWRRDRGRCAHCGSREKLEFDHIVPLSMRGSDTARNIELLCESCNRQKGAAVSVGSSEPHG
jgi:hypothetical protein